MTIKRIKKWYLWIGLANFLLSVMFFIQNSESSSMEVFSAFIVSNVGYHLLYFFVGFFSRSSIKRIVQENRIAEITVWMNKLFAYVTIVIGILMSLLFLSSALDFEVNLLAAFTPLGMTLGGFALLDFLNQLDSPPK